MTTANFNHSMADLGFGLNDYGMQEGTGDPTYNVEYAPAHPPPVAKGRRTLSTDICGPSPFVVHLETFVSTCRCYQSMRE